MNEVLFALVVFSRLTGALPGILLMYARLPATGRTIPRTWCA